MTRISRVSLVSAAVLAIPATLYTIGAASGSGSVFLSASTSISTSDFGSGNDSGSGSGCDGKTKASPSKTAVQKWAPDGAG
ncbi:MAG TPA: hypothetical protein VH092_03465, partial [Urbifossiella sp.]|nr:hypothetical protein [Urbifossiella sp.]